ncbi:thiamine-phosphate kinase [Tumidithrix elongata RA019]|uniref:Thiamine-monophosphate kinase n=1 Tax=Tumidithrix elongata BACA0141 TaxID=2716417 RepID=A0AAW9PYE7_9CYAN|nr:thiamine-phosphate kinase [Tumidithrix elongata RA019]
MTKTIKELGERGLLQLFRPYCSDRIGDDAALMGATLPDCEMVVTTDILIDGVHFSEKTTSPEDAGWRAAAANLSDLAAMGAEPWGVVISVGLPPDTPVAWIEGVYRGFTDCLHLFGTELVGGDTVRSPVLTLAVTAFGQVHKHRIIQRHTAKVGDVILTTGQHGLSKAGLELLLHPELSEKLQNGISSISIEDTIAKLHAAHQRPIPKLDVPPLLGKLLESHPPFHSPFPISGMDSSDGLADAIAQICRASGVGAKLDWQAISIPESIHQLAGDRALDWVLYGGEDFELVLCLPLTLAQALLQELPHAAIVGEIIAERNLGGLDMHHTFQHFI